MDDRCIGVPFPTEAIGFSLLLIVRTPLRPIEFSQQELFPLVEGKIAGL
jgi:hypothetical protein